MGTFSVYCVFVCLFLKVIIHTDWETFVRVLCVVGKEEYILFYFFNYSCLVLCIHSQNPTMNMIQQVQKTFRRWHYQQFPIVLTGYLCGAAFALGYLTYLKRRNDITKGKWMSS